MSAGVLWIILPILFAILLLLLNNTPQVSMVIGAVINTAIVISIVVLKVDHNYLVGSTLIRIEPVLKILGRNLLIEDADRVVLFFLYALSAVYLWLGVVFDGQPTFAPLSILVSALMTSALSVESRLYFILFVELAVLVCLPLLVRKKGRKERGEHFLLIFISLSIPLLLLGGWAADSVAANPIDTEMIDRAAVFMILGFSMMIGVFPFFFWMPQISSESRPVRANFVLSILSFGFLYLLFTIGDAGGWLRSNETLIHWLQVMGFIMIVLGGVWAAFQDDLGRYFAFGLIIDNGFAFLALKNALTGDSDSFYLLLTIRLLVYLLFTMATAYLYNRGIELTLNGLRGKFQRYPFVFIALFVTIFSFNSLPLMANFTIRFGILQKILSSEGVDSVLWPLIGQLGFFLGALRFLGSCVEIKEGVQETQSENWLEKVVFLAGMLVLLTIGFLPTQATSWILKIWSGLG